MTAINTNQILAMLEQIKAVSAQVAPPSAKVQNIARQANQADGTEKTQGKSGVDFATALRNTIDGVNALQVQSEQLGEQFTLGNDDVQLSDVMISMQKASIALQTTVQVRNRLVSAYQEIMGMQI